MSDLTQPNAYQALFEHSSVGIVIASQDGLIEQANPFAHKIFGYVPGELIGQRIEALIPMKLRGRHVEHRAQYNSDPRPRVMGIGRDLMALRKDGTEFPVEISLASYESEGKRQIVSFINDITERKKAETALQELNAELERKVKDRTNELSQAILELQHTNANLKQAEEDAKAAFEKERELSELKSRFVSMASHEFRTPLSGILTSASLIDRYSQTGDEAKRHKHVQTIKSCVQNLTHILNDFLSLDKLEQGRVECNPVLFTVKDFVGELVEEMNAVPAQEDRIAHEHRGSEGEIRLDRDMLKNVLLNLLSNALKYSEKEIRLLTELTEDALIITVQDRGIGIPHVDQKNLFERFFRAKNASTIQGTGLGLNIVRRYLDLMGGTIDFESRENEGTTFTVILPKEG